MEGNLILSSVESISVNSLLVSGFLGRRLNVSRLDETKIGVRPGGPAGNFGGVMDSPTGFSVVLTGFCLERNC